jgi:hypothetical protein
MEQNSNSKTKKTRKQRLVIVGEYLTKERLEAHQRYMREQEERRNTSWILCEELSLRIDRLIDQGRGIPADEGFEM